MPEQPMNEERGSETQSTDPASYEAANRKLVRVMVKSGIIFAVLSALINLLPHRIDYRDTWAVIHQAGLALGGGFVVGALYGLCIEAMRNRQR